MNLNRISGEVVDAAITIHRELGPGLLESVYEIVLAQELKHRGFSVERQAPVSITYKEMHFEEGFRCDLLIENQVIVELKSVESLSKLHKKTIADISHTFRATTRFITQLRRIADERRYSSHREQPR